MKLDFGFGNSVCVREAFVDTYDGDPILFNRDELSKFDYPLHTGDSELVEITKQIIKRQIGTDYRHVLLTNGATGGVAISLRSYAHRGYLQCQTRNAPHYMRYPGIINAAGLIHTDESFWTVNKETVILLDIPSNPLGLIDNPYTKITTPIILDGVYYNNVYTKGNVRTPFAHDILIGSYGKLLGINGIRVGWIATNDDILYERLKELVIAEYCGLNVSGTTILKKVLKDFRWDIFESDARANLNNNREQWSKLEKYFENEPVPEIGMFYYCKIDEACEKLLNKSSIIWTKGSALGTNDKYGRFNLGQSCELTREAVRGIIKNDRR